MDTNVKKKTNEEQGIKTIIDVFDKMFSHYVERGQIRRENFDKDGYDTGSYKFIVKEITKKMEEDFSNASKYAKMFEVADRFYKIIVDKKVRERIIDSKLDKADFMKYYGDEILGEHKRSFDRSHNYIEGLITLGEETVITTVSSPELFGSIRAYDMDGNIPYTEIGSIFEKARRDTEKIKLENQRRKPKQIVEVKKALNLVEKVGEPFPFDHQGGKVFIQEVGELEYTVGNERGNRVRRYRVIKKMEGKGPVEVYVFSNIDLYDMRENTEYCEAVLGELLSDNNISKSNASGYIGELSDDIGELKRMRIGDEIDDGDYIYKTPYKSKNGQFYGLVYDSENLSAVVEWEKEQQKEKEKSDQVKDTPKKEEKKDDELEL